MLTRSWSRLDHHEQEPAGARLGHTPPSGTPACGSLVGAWDCVWPRAANGRQNHLPLSRGEGGVKVAWVRREEEPAAGPVWGITPDQLCVACSSLDLSQP